MKNIVKDKLLNTPGCRQIESFLDVHPTVRDMLRRLAGSMDARACIVIAALLGPVALFIPWLSLDGHGSPLSGFGLITYALQGNDRLVMWKISPLAISLLLVVPFGIAVGVCWTALNVLRRVYRLDVPLFTLAGILMLLRFAPPILDGRMYTLGGFAMPGPGLAILVVASLAVIAISSNATLRRRSVPAQP